VKWPSLLSLLLFPFLLFGDPIEVLLDSLEEEGITFDLISPTFEEGRIFTDEGGVISAPQLRIQARHISYFKDDNGLWLEAEGDLMVTFGPYTLVGDFCRYDLLTKEGVICNGRSAVEPWYFGGKEIYLHCNSSIEVRSGYLTTSEKACPDWKIEMSEAHFFSDHYFSADNVTVRILRMPLFWLPKLRANLDWIFDSPIRYRVRWGGQQGFRLGMIYEAFDWNHFKTFLRLDYRIERGPGGGIETYYYSPVKNHWFHTINYIANDSSLDNPQQQTRYRLEGLYHNEWDCGRTSFDLSYDYLSDKDMPTDYQDQGLDLKAAQQTQFNLRRQQDELVIANLYTRVRINNFQTVKQELPSLEGHFKPQALGCTGAISDSHFDIGYFDFKYDQDDLDATNFHAARAQFFERLYRPFHMGCLHFTPYAEGVAILYGSGPTSNIEWLALGSFGVLAKTDFYRTFRNMKHVAQPYAHYEYITTPTISPTSHFIFDITDGWFRLNTLRTGLKNLIYVKSEEGCISPYLEADFYTYTFFDTQTVYDATPRLYLDLEWHPTYRIKQQVSSAWDFERNAINYVNYRTEVTISDDIAFAGEYRQRSAFAWRKAQYRNFILDSFRTEQELRDSLVSDRRNTLLFHLFYRLDTTLASEFAIRHGWNRMNEPSYTEYEYNLLVNLRASWQMRLSLQKNEGESRVTLYFNLLGSDSKPNCF